MVALVDVVLDERLDLGFEAARQEEISQQDAASTHPSGPPKDAHSTHS